LRSSVTLAASLLLLLGCGKEPFLDLQIAQRDLPLLVAGRDYDNLGVRAGAEGCAPVDRRYPPAVLPATLTIVRGSCFLDRVTLQASAWLGSTKVAESATIAAAFGDSGATVVTATLARVQR
jgi:hypothetical protein